MARKPRNGSHAGSQDRKGPPSVETSARALGVDLPPAPAASALTPSAIDARRRRIGELYESILAQQDIAQDAMDAGKYSAATKALQEVNVLQAQVLRLELQERIDTEPDDLQRLRLLKSQAELEGAFTAVGKLAALEQEILVRRAEAEARARLETLDGQPDEEVLELVLQAIDSLPEPLLERIEGHIRDRLGLVLTLPWTDPGAPTAPSVSP